jgi:cell division protein FtsB
MRLLIVVLTVVLALLQARLWLSNGGLREVWRLETEVARRVEENQRLAARNSALEAEVRDLKQGLAAAEERARTELGMIRAGETFYQITPPGPPTQR